MSASYRDTEDHRITVTHVTLIQHQHQAVTVNISPAQRDASTVPGETESSDSHLTSSEFPLEPDP